MLCLHGKLAAKVTTEIGHTFWFCPEKPRCFVCSDMEAPLYEEAIKEFLATKKERPKCCTITGTGVGERCYAKFRVITGKENPRWWSWWSGDALNKENIGRPIFTCGNKNRQDSRGCGYVEWGDIHSIDEEDSCDEYPVFLSDLYSESRLMEEKIKKRLG